MFFQQKRCYCLVSDEGVVAGTTASRNWTRNCVSSELVLLWSGFHHFCKLFFQFVVTCDTPTCRSRWARGARASVGATRQVAAEKASSRVSSDKSPEAIVRMRRCWASGLLGSQKARSIGSGWIWWYCHGVLARSDPPSPPLHYRCTHSGTEVGGRSSCPCSLDRWRDKDLISTRDLWSINSLFVIVH